MQTQDRLEDLIGAIVADPALHARWLNTFSYLEYVGFRKIVKSQRAEVLTAAILGHACEKKPGIAPARGLGYGASLEDDNLHPRACEVIGGGDTRDACAHDRDVRGDLAAKRGMEIRRHFVEPDAGHFR